MSKGFTKRWRNIEEWEWYTTPHMTHLFMHLVGKANHEEGKWKGVEIKRGQTITSLPNLSKETGISTQSVRTCIKRLKSTGEITEKITNKYRNITISGYEKFQSNDKPLTDKLTDRSTVNQQTTNRQLTSNKKNKKNKNDKNIVDANASMSANADASTPDYSSGNDEGFDSEARGGAVAEVGRGVKQHQLDDKALNELLRVVRIVFEGEKRLTSCARKKLHTRLKTYSIEEITSAFKNLVDEPDQWKIKHNGFRSLAWWLNSDERIEEMLQCHKKYAA